MAPVHCSGPLLFLEPASEVISVRGISAVTLDVVIGLLMQASVPLIISRATSGIPLALTSALILIVLGGTAGVTGGLFGLVGVILDFHGSCTTLLQ